LCIFVVGNVLLGACPFSRWNPKHDKVGHYAISLWTMLAGTCIACFLGPCCWTSLVFVVLSHMLVSLLNIHARHGWTICPLVRA
jgi:hypothetical protein